MKKIELKKIIKQKNKNLARITPKFVITCIEKILHIKEINFIINEFGKVNGIDFNNSILKYLNITIEIVGRENIPKEGRFLFASNHPLGGLDGMALTKVASEYFHENVRFFVNDILTNIEPFAPVFVPINKHGKQSKQDIVMMNQIFDSKDYQIIFFPAGLVSRKKRGRIIDLEWKKTFLSKSIEYGRTIIPIYIDGENSRLFYEISRIRKIMRLPNIEMMLLPHELFRQRGKTIKIIVGKPIENRLLKRLKPEDIKEKVYDLANL